MPNWMGSDQLILVLGVGGFVGSALSAKLRENYQVIGVTRSSRDGLDPGTYLLDLTIESSRDVLKHICEKSSVSLIIDASSSGVTPSQRNSKTSMELTSSAKTITSASAALGIPVIHFSTVAIHERRLSNDPYVIGKAKAVALFHDLLSHGGRGAVIYTPRIFGPNEPRGRFLSDMVSALKTGEDFLIRDGSLRRSFISLADITHFISDLPHLFLDSGLPKSLSIPLSFSATLHEVGQSILRIGKQKGLAGSIRFESRNTFGWTDDYADERIFQTSLVARLTHGSFSLALPSIEADDRTLDERFKELF